MHRGFENARIALAKALRRIEGGARSAKLNSIPEWPAKLLAFTFCLPYDAMTLLQQRARFARISIRAREFPYAGKHVITSCAQAFG